MRKSCILHKKYARFIQVNVQNRASRDPNPVTVFKYKTCVIRL